LISVDFSALIITALVFTLVLVLGRFFFQPLASAMEKRQGKIDAAENIRVETMKEVEEILATHRGAMSGVRDEDYEALEKARSAGQAEADRLFGAEREKTRQDMARAREELRQQSEAALRSLESESDRLAAEIASRILGRKAA
jgi:F-type H+-transporting ATPase subunit b